MRIDPNKIYLKAGLNEFNMPVSCNFDGIMIGYKGVGEYFIPQKMLIDPKFKLPKDPGEYVCLLLKCIKESQYINFEEMVGIKKI